MFDAYRLENAGLGEVQDFGDGGFAAFDGESTILQRRSGGEQGGAFLSERREGSYFGHNISGRSGGGGVLFGHAHGQARLLCRLLHQHLGLLAQRVGAGLEQQLQRPTVFLAPAALATLPSAAPQVDAPAWWRVDHRVEQQAGFVLGLFERLERESERQSAELQQAQPPDQVLDAFADAILTLDSAMPTGTYVDMCSKLPLVDPAQVKAATLIMRGEYDGIASLDDLLNFFKLLPCTNKQFSIMQGISHASFQQKNHLMVYQILHSFFSQPEPTYKG